MSKIVPQKIMVSILVISLLVSLGFLSGFTYPDDSIGTSILKYNDEGTEEQDEENEFGEDEEQDEVEKWICGVCGYIYDPTAGDPENGIVEGTVFEDLPETWVCPVCGSAKLEFEIENDEQLNETETDSWLAHLKHVLEMRSKHIMVLQRVVEKMISKDPLHPSISALQHALQSSSKSIQKAQEAIAWYNGDLNNSNDIDNDNNDIDNDNDGADNDLDDNGTNLEDQNNRNIENATSHGNNSKGNKGNGKGKNKVNKGKGKNK